MVMEVSILPGEDIDQLEERINKELEHVDPDSVLDIKIFPGAHQYEEYIAMIIFKYAHSMRER